MSQLQAMYFAFALMNAAMILIIVRNIAKLDDVRNFFGACSIVFQLGALLVAVVWGWQ